MKRESDSPSGAMTPVPVARAHESARRFGDEREQLVEVRVGLDEENCVDESVETRRIVDFMKRHL